MNRLSEKLRERIDECVRFMSEIDEEVFDKAVQKLAYYEDLEEAGRIVTLPCKVGDTVYQLRNKNHGKGLGISPRIVSSACVWSDGSYSLCHQGMTYCQSKDLGKTWFLTREEAEKALEGMK